MNIYYDYVAVNDELESINFNIYKFKDDVYCDDIFFLI